MTARIPNIKIPTVTPSFSKKFVKQMAGSGLLPVMALEAFVEAGRTYQAGKRGGFDEARERITEEFMGAVFWLSGVKALNWLFEKVGQKFYKLPNINVPIASDEVRNPLQNFLHFEKHKNGGKILESTMSKFKFAKVFSSVLLANAFIGFVLPKVNQGITRWYHRKNDNTQQTNITPFPTMDSFVNKNKEDNNQPKSKDVPFGMNLLSIANKLENNRNWQLISVDVGNTAGRTISARNDDERVEVFFRDTASVYFYMFNMPNMNQWLNKIEQKGYGSRLDPVMSEFTTKYMHNYLDAKGVQSVTAEEFEKDMFGKKVTFTQNLKNKFKNTNIITLEDFTKELKTIVPAEELAQYEQLAKQMSELQPQIKGTSILTKKQAQMVLEKGCLYNPEFLKGFYKTAFKENIPEFIKRLFKIEDSGENFMHKYKYVEQGSLDKYLEDLEHYVKTVIEQAKKSHNGEINADMLTKMCKKNFRMNILNWGTGFAISALFLSTLIPKIQYAITKFRTGSTDFPGTAEYREKLTK